MKGIYVLDLADQRLFVCSANDINDAIQIIPSNITYDLSYHYYPLYENEKDDEGEFRIYKKMIGINSLQNVLARVKTLSRIATGSWTPSLSRLNNMSGVDLANMSERKSLDETSSSQKQSPDVFSLSL